MKVVLLDDDSVYRFFGATLIKRLKQIETSDFYEDGESAMEANRAYTTDSFPDFFFIDININAWTVGRFSTRFRIPTKHLACSRKFTLSAPLHSLQI